MSIFSIAEFDDGLQLVPTTWLTNKNTLCKWPLHLKQSKLNKAIEAREKPKENWIECKIVKIFGTARNYRLL